VNPFVSVIIPTSDNLAMISQVVPGVLEHTRHPFELIVIDNASQDPAVQEYLDGLSGTSAVRIVRMPENRYYWPAINEGIRHCDPACAFVLALNDDCVILGSSWVERLLSFFAGDASIGFVGDLMMEGEFPPLQGVVDGYCTMFQREIFEIVGLFDERNPFWWGFVDFQLRALRKGFRGTDVKQSGDQHDHIVGIVLHLRGQTVGPLRRDMKPALRKKLFGGLFAKVAVLARNGYPRHAVGMLIRQSSAKVRQWLGSA